MDTIFYFEINLCSGNDTKKLPTEVIKYLKGREHKNIAGKYKYNGWNTQSSLENYNKFLKIMTPFVDFESTDVKINPVRNQKQELNTLSSLASQSERDQYK